MQRDVHAVRRAARPQHGRQSNAGKLAERIGACAGTDYESS